MAVLFQMNGLNCSVTRRRGQNLNRRKVAVISSWPGSSRRTDSKRSLELGVKGRRQLVYTSQWSDDNMLDVDRQVVQHSLVRRVNSSQESIMGGQLLGHTEPRVRQMSGNMSEHSHNSSLKVN